MYIWYILIKPLLPSAHELQNLYPKIRRDIKKKSYDHCDYESKRAYLTLCREKLKKEFRQ